MTVTAMPGTGRRHRVVAIGSGLGGLTATKALKRDLVSMTDAVAFLTRLTAQGTAHVHHQASLWLQAIPTAAAVLIILAALASLSIAGRSASGIRNDTGKVGADYAIHRTT